MNKYQIVYFFLISICIFLFSQGCSQRCDEDFFYFIKEVYPEESYKLKKINNKVYIIKNISLEEFYSSKDKLLKNNFTQWHKLDNSAGFIIGVDGEIFFKGTTEKAIIYSKSNEKNSKYIPIILLDINEETLYCVLATDFGG